MNSFKRAIHNFYKRTIVGIYLYQNYNEMKKHWKSTSIILRLARIILRLALRFGQITHTDGFLAQI